MVSRAVWLPLTRPGLLGAALLLAGVTGCGEKGDTARAAQGSIDRQAAVQTIAEVSIKAPVSIVWKTLSDVAQWPAWQPDIQTATITMPAAAGVPFEWTTAGGTIHSRVVLYEPEHRLAWIGHVLIFHAVHVWAFTALGHDETAVTTTESLSGWPIGWFYSSDELHEADQRWLVALKRAAEQIAESARARAG